MELNEILKQPEGFTPPDVTVTIKKVWDYKAGSNNDGPWSFQNIEVEGGGKLKLKSLPEFPKAREGQTVTLRANQSKQHGLTGMKVSHEEYKGKTYHQLVVTNSCKWEWGPGSTNGSSAPQSSRSAFELSVEGYTAHLLSCAALTNQITGLLGISEQDALQACFATICIDTKNRGILLPKDLPAVIPALSTQQNNGDAYENAPSSIVDKADLPDDYSDDPPF